MEPKRRKKHDPFLVPESDPFGSYTGTTVDGDEPVQDADDL